MRAEGETPEAMTIEAIEAEHIKPDAAFEQGSRTELGVKAHSPWSP
mgnify:CR=1 FL=1